MTLAVEVVVIFALWSLFAFAARLAYQHWMARQQFRAFFWFAAAVTVLWDACTR